MKNKKQKAKPKRQIKSNLKYNVFIEKVEKKKSLRLNGKKSLKMKGRKNLKEKVRNRKKKNVKVEIKKTKAIKKTK